MIKTTTKENGERETTGGVNFFFSICVFVSVNKQVVQNVKKMIMSLVRTIRTLRRFEDCTSLIENRIELKRKNGEERYISRGLILC